MADTEKYATTFQIVDADGDGQITAEEFQRLMDMRGDKITLEQAAAFVAKYDGDGDGRISLDEFAEMLEQGFNEG
jgi:Ca2+-binding EF-hand superfamily protein